MEYAFTLGFIHEQRAEAKTGRAVEAVYYVL